MLSRARPGVHTIVWLAGAYDEDVDAIEREGKKDPEQRREEEAAEDGEDGVSGEESGRGGGVRWGGGVFVGGVECRRVHGATSIILSVGERFVDCHPLKGEAGTSFG